MRDTVPVQMSPMLHGDALAARIRGEICTRGISRLDEAELASIWDHDITLSDIQKRGEVDVFSLRYGFTTILDYGFWCAVFHDSGKARIP
jgi:hypothetical protein